MKKALLKISSAFMALLMILVSAAPAYASEASIKDKVPSDKNKTITYRIDKESRTLYIDGSGAIPDYYMGFTEREVLENYQLSDNANIYRALSLDTTILPKYYIEINRVPVKNLVIGEGITSIGKRAFAYALPCVTGNVVLPSTLKSIGQDAFDGVPAITSPAYKYKTKTARCKNKSVKYKFDKANSRINITGKGAIPNNYLGWTKSDFNAMNDAVRRAMSVPDEPDEKDIFVWKDGRYENGYGVTYEDCYAGSFPRYYIDTNFTNQAYFLTLGNGITSVGDNAFAYCFNYVYEIRLPSTVKSIGKNAFAGMTADRVIIPSGVKTLAGDAFVGKSVNCDGRNYSYQTEIVITGKDTEIKGKIYQSYVVPKGSKAEKTLKNAKCKYKTVSAPKAPSNVKLSAKSKGVKVSCKAKNAVGYQIEYATDSKFKKNKKTVNVKSKKGISKSISGLKGKKKYYVRVRVYKTYGDAKFYGAWSKAKAVTTKK